jgi:hypothetical protein
MKTRVNTLVTLPQALERLPIHPQSLYRHIRLGHVPSVRFGARVFISEATLDKITTDGLQWEPKKRQKNSKTVKPSK